MLFTVYRKALAYATMVKVLCMVFVLNPITSTSRSWPGASSQAFSFENARRAKNGPYRIKWAGHRRAMSGNVTAKQGDVCLLFGGLGGTLMARAEPR